MNKTQRAKKRNWDKNIKDEKEIRLYTKKDKKTEIEK